MLKIKANLIMAAYDGKEMSIDRINLVKNTINLRSHTGMTISRVPLSDVEIFVLKGKDRIVIRAQDIKAKYQKEEVVLERIAPHAGIINVRKSNGIKMWGVPMEDKEIELYIEEA